MKFRIENQPPDDNTLEFRLRLNGEEIFVEARKPTTEFILVSWVSVVGQVRFAGDEALGELGLRR